MGRVAQQYQPTEETMRQFYRTTCVILITVAVAALLCCLAWVGLHNRAMLDTNPGSPVPGQEEVQGAPEGGKGAQDGGSKREAPQSATVDSAVDKYRAWLEERRGLQFEEDAADDMALAVCGAFDAGTAYDAVSDSYMVQGYTMEESVTIVMGAIAYYCPEHNKAVDAYLNGAVADMGESI